MVVPGFAGFRSLTKVHSAGGVEAFTAWSDTLGAEVALEVVPPQLVTPLVSTGFETLALAAPRLDHEALVRPLSLTRLDTGAVCLAFERVEGDTLAALLARKGPLVAVDALVLLEKLCAGLSVAHQARLPHGDIRPEHVLLPGGLQAFNPKLAGFGRALMTLPPEAQGYLAPERLLGAHPSPAADVFSLGALLCTMLTGKPPFALGDLKAALEARSAEKPVPLPPDAAHLAEIVRQCLRYDPAARLQDLSEILRWATRSNRTLITPAERPAVQPPVAQQPVTRAGQPVPLQLATPGAPPARLGSYELIKLLGEGTMGQVYLGRHARLGRLVAIKVLRPEQYQRAELVQRFFQEARSVNQISHEHIVEVIDFVEEPGTRGPQWVYTVMEHLEGQTLGQVLSAGSIEPGRGVRIIQQVCEALDAAHAVGVVHRDLKPDNIFLTERAGQKDYVKVLDFGVAKLLRPTLGAPAISTLDGAIIGTPIFMSPEQALGVAVDRRADIYAAGAILYRILAGKLAFDGATFGAVLTAVISKPPPPLPRVTPAGHPIPPELAKLVLRCLSKDREERPPTMAALREELAPFASAAAAAESLPVKPRVKRTGRRWALASLVVLVGLAAGAVALRPQLTTRLPLNPFEPAPASDVDAVAVPPLFSKPLEPAPAGELPEETVAPAQSKPVEADVVPRKPRLPPRAPGPPTAAEFRATVSQSTPALKRCVERFQVQLAADHRSSVLLGMTVEPSGAVSSATTSGLENTPVGSCLAAVVKKLQFPRYSGPRVSYQTVLNLQQ